MRRSAGVVMLLILGTIALPAHILAQQTESWNGQVRDLECRLLSGVDQAAPEPQDLRAGDEALAPVRVTWRAPAQAASGPAASKQVLYQIAEQSTGTWRVIRSSVSATEVTLYLIKAEPLKVRVLGYYRDAGPKGEPTEATCRVTEASTADAEGELARTALAVLAEPQVVLPSSEVIWIGTIVALAAYEGAYEEVARMGVRQGYTLGLLTSDEGLLCLEPVRLVDELFAALEELTGERAEVVGMLSHEAGTTVVSVTRVRPAP